ncbi:TFIIH basal transcription factor complex helicase repB subunit [Gracilariopsis chorda]|uniref:DNA 3'-5' helicase n=1 Tax=Gracilariopsis chorda TaxID=448386 RepID=A0A2V3ISZ9_9FLOR|nr:TFIIH basal transcription factor complex helicase repB subunit [Gracilariopsis chorda]|eukprot:PXF45241.1 TFIIH basal transcription factor complex helicase repB subunit [Gracilariopsis chorda]
MDNSRKRPRQNSVIDVDSQEVIDLESNYYQNSYEPNGDEARRLKKERKDRKKEKKRKKKKRKERSDSDSDSDYDPNKNSKQSERVVRDESDDLPMLPRAACTATFNVEEDEDDDAEVRDYSQLALRPDHTSRPVYVSGDKRIFLETFSPIYKQAYDFLVAIAEPVSRPEQLHEYRLTEYALYAAVSVGLDSESIIRALGKLCKTSLPKEIPQFIRDCTKTYGKAKLVLKKGKYVVQTMEENVMRVLLSDRTISSARVPESEIEDAKEVETEDKGLVIAGGEEAVSDAKTLQALAKALDEEDDEEEIAFSEGKKKKVFEFEVRGEEVEHVKRQAIALDYPLMEEYDFRNDTANPNIDLDLKPIAKIRPYQEKSLEKMFGNGRARSGVIVLPCGAGKSLVGVTAACTVKKPTLCLCTSSVSVEQWRYQFATWSTMPREQIGRFVASSGGHEKSFYGGVTVTTYSMISHSGRRAAESERMLNELKQKEWGLLLLDEVHVVPANVFRKVIGVIKAHCKLGLTATLLREDEKIGDINFLIGPKLYEANWLDLQRDNYLATVQCAEVWCPMTKEFYREYLASHPARRKLLYAMNPNKFRMCQYLVNFHEQRGDKVIIFADNVYALKMYANRLSRPYIYGPTSQTERLRILQNFQHNPALNTILLSKVGDTSIDIPEANVLIQVSSHYGSRRQEAQRLGRILRPKPRAGQNFNAFFYSLVSTDTQEMFYSSKRQQFLIDQGYAFKVITHLEGMDKAKLDFETKQEQLALLAKVLAADETEASEHLDVDEEERALAARGPDGGFGSLMRRRPNSIEALTGARGVRYNEFDRRKDNVAPLPKSRRVVQHSLFRRRIAGGFTKKK